MYEPTRLPRADRNGPHHCSCWVFRSGDGPPEEAEEPNEPAAGEEGSNTEAPEEETTDTDAEEQPEPEPTEEVDQPEAQSFSGSGAEVEQDVPIGGG